MEKRELGKTGLQVTPLGFGTAQIGFLDVPQPDCDRLLNGLLDAGMNVVDTAACYGGAEEKIGKAISHRREEYVLVSKCGHHVDEDDPPDWSPDIVRKSAERSLKRLKTDFVDVMLIHSCGVEDLKNDALVRELVRCKEGGLVRSVGYSGDNESAQFALEMGVFECFETSLSVFDQQVLDTTLPKAAAEGLGVFLKRPIANGCWRNMEGYGGGYENYVRPYVERFKAMNFTPQSIGFEGSWTDLALRFSAFQPGVSTAPIGGKNLEHLYEDIEIVRKGPLPDEVVKAIRGIWRQHDDGSWKGQT